MTRWTTTAVWQFLTATTTVLCLIALAVTNTWPFDGTAIDPGNDPSIAELALGDRLTIGLIRTAVLAVVSYVVVSVPALVLERRWIQGLTTTGVTAGDHREDFSRQLAQMREWLVTRGDPGASLSKIVESLHGLDPSSEADDDDS